MTLCYGDFSFAHAFSFFHRLTAHSGVLLLLTLLLTGCEVFSSGYEEENKLDVDLRTQLVDAANGQGLAFFRLPDSDDLAAIPQDPRNPLTAEKVALGKLLYHETGLLTEPKRETGMFSSSCAACHHAQAGFQANVPQGIGEGGIGFGQLGEGRKNDPLYQNDLDVQPIRTPSALNVAYQQVMLWNGQFGAVGPNAGTESQWAAETPKAVNHLGYEGVESQAIAGLTVHRMGKMDASMVEGDSQYKQLLEAAFPGVDKAERMTTEHIGLTIAAYERTLLPSEAPFQRWLRGENGAMTDQEKEGAILFFGKAECATCHTGPALSSMTFHALGVNELNGGGVYGDFSADVTTRLGRGGFTGRTDDNYKFKTPQLYNLSDSPFYGHGAEFRSIREVVEYKNRAVPSNPDVPTSQLAEGFKPLNLTATEVDALVAFLQNALRDPELTRYVPESLPTGNCFPVNDPAARSDLGC
ncbi:MAG TPA: cytochrome c peroxidase [Rhodothermales bacterium]|nr:cytochrome c peroxidase [Rhodothermales bacterium]